MDAVLYLQKAKETYTEDLQEDLLSDLEVIDEKKHLKEKAESEDQ